MLIDIYEIEWLARDRANEMLRAAEHERLIELAQEPRSAWKARWPLTLTWRGWLAAFSKRGAKDARRVSLATVPGVTCEVCPGT